MSASSDKTETMKPWKQHLLEARQHYGRLNASLWRWTKAMAAVFDDAEFRADNQLRDDFAAAAWIDQEFPGLPFGFLELRAILTVFPEEKSWRNAKLSDLWDRARDTARLADDRPRRTISRITKAEHQAVVEERDFWKARAEYLEKENSKLKETIADLRSQEILEPVCA